MSTTKRDDQSLHLIFFCDNSTFNTISHRPKRDDEFNTQIERHAYMKYTPKTTYIEIE